MEVGAILMAVVIFGAFFVGIMLKKDADPRDSASGRWGIKAGKVVRGEFGGEKWGEKPRK